ncbi:MAG: DedA family protein [Holosporaceae bacterium]|jgi:membrane protein YqaA with SNARE-associated domain|nr:DedA family protein [Holosporaceae bacterium]
MIEKLYNWMMKQAESKNAVGVLMFVSFIESSFFPLPPDPVLAIVVAKNRDKAIYYAAMCTLASVLGGFLGYYIGYAFFQLIGAKILAFYGQVEKFEEIVITLNKWAFWIICAKGLTPIPYKIVTIASGFAKIDLCTFAVASMITRSMRFLVLSMICKIFGEQFLNFIEKHKKITLFLIIISVIIGFLLVKIFI